MTAVSQIVRTAEQNLADACLNSYASITDAPLPIPAVLIPPSGTAPVIDCGDLLIVRCASVSSAFQGPPEACAIVPVLNLEATVTRCVPNLTDFGKPASQAKLNTAGLSLADDASTLWFGVTFACATRQLWTGFAGLECADTKFRDMTPGAAGNIAWFSWKISVNVTCPLAAGNDPIVWSTEDSIDWGP